METSDLVSLTILVAILVVLVAVVPAAREVATVSFSPGEASVLSGGGTVTPRFKLIFLTVVGLTVVLLAVGVYLSLQPRPTPQVIETARALLDLGKGGVGAIFGLLGGKSL